MKIAKRPKEKAPIDCTFSELLRIKRDNLAVGDFWVVTDSYEVTFAQQKLGESPTQKITIPIKTLRRLVKFLTTPAALTPSQE